jgi:hypothetical protein
MIALAPLGLARQTIEGAQNDETPVCRGHQGLERDAARHGKAVGSSYEALISTSRFLCHHQIKSMIRWSFHHDGSAERRRDYMRPFSNSDDTE